MTSVEISLIKKGYQQITAAQGASASAVGSIVFDKTHKVICVGGDIYGGNIQDVNYNTENNQLTITKADGTTQTLDFSDVASAQGTMAVFGQLRDIIGITNDVQGVQGHFIAADATYIQGAQSVVQAAVQLDQAIAHVQGVVDGLQDVAFSAQANDLGIMPVTYGDITLQGQDGAVAQNAQNAFEGLLQGVIDNEKVTEEAFEAVQNAVGLDEHLNYVQHVDGHYVQGAQSVDQAITALDNAVKSVVVGANTYVINPTTTTDGYLKSYQLQEVNASSGTITQVGVKIDIPKDFLVKSATSGTVTAADVAQGGKFGPGTPYEGQFAEGDVYLDFVINTRESVQPADEHIYINMNSIADSYNGDSANVISDYTAPSFTNREGRADVNIDQTNNRISVTVQDGAITTVKIADKAVQGTKIADLAVDTPQLQNAAVNSDKLADGAVQSNHIAPSAVQTIGIQDGAVTTNKIAESAVQTASIQDGSVTAAKLAQGLVNIPSTQTKVIVNDQTDGGTTIATIAGQPIKVESRFYWNEWE